MRFRSTRQTYVRDEDEETMALLASEIPVNVLPELPASRSSTGTVDDEDEREDEHEGENEARERAKREDTEAPEEFVRDDEERSDFAK